jgi:GTP-binding protein HflX
MDGKEKEAGSTEIHFNAWYDKERIQESKALLIGVFRTNKEEDIAVDHINELDLLARTHKIPVVDRWCTLIRDFSAATFLSAGKLAQLKDRVVSTGANIVIFDDEITPVQQRNLETALRMPVMDRTEVILGVFADRAKTREAKLQIEMAQVKYIAPRLKRMWLHLSRQTGGGGGATGGGYLRGKGEKQIEMDRRALKRRLERLQDELKGVARYRQTQRVRRERTAIPVFAIVGYTNAGKSTLLNRLTNAHVLVEDMLFATLDTTTRQFSLPNNQPVLLVDTVGFIRKLPHLLVAAFKSTLEESVEADVLIHLIDSSHPLALEQAKTTFEVLAELKAKDRPIITVINKVDLAKEGDAHHRAMIQKLRLTYPRAIQVSALTGEGLDHLFEEMMEVLKTRRKRIVLKIPQSEYNVLVSAIREGTVFSKSYVENDIVVDVELPLAHAQQLAQYICDVPQEVSHEVESIGE